MIKLITDVEYFWMLDNQIRVKMQKFETDICYPKAKTLLTNSNINIEELKKYPIEGYYTNSPELSQYFTILRNLQHNEEVYKKVIQCAELEFLQRVCHRDLFGIIDPKNRNKDAPLQRRYDLVTLAMEDPQLFDLNSPRPWTISSIMTGCNIWYANRTNLVELAVLIGKPELVCAGAETNSAYRMIAAVSGACGIAPIIEYKWKVSPDVELLGSKIVEEYNNLLEGFYIITPSIYNCNGLNSIPVLPRVSVMGYILETNQYYHWILDWNGTLTDVYSQTIITTNSFINKTTGLSGNIFNCKP